MAGALQESNLQKHQLLHLDAFYFPNFVTVSIPESVKNVVYNNIFE